jgi:two-component system, cell cycle response regulator CpdR
MPRIANRILVVEDNADALHTVCAMLQVVGYQTDGVLRAEAALDVIAKDQFEVILTDINLPGMSGIELASIVAETSPATRIIFGSGAGYLVAEETRFNFSLLQKPYFLPQLRTALADEQPALPAAYIANRIDAQMNAR